MKVRWARYVAGMGGNCMQGFGLKTKRATQKIWFRWKDNIEMDLKCDDMVWRRYISGSREVPLPDTYKQGKEFRVS